MTTERSDVVYGYWRDATDKFDYFVAGVTGALTAYIGQHVRPTQLGINAGSLELLALVLLVLSVVMSFKRIETNIEVFKAMHARLYSEETRGSMIAAAGRGTALNTATGDVFSSAQLLELAELHDGRVKQMRSTLDSLAAASLSYYNWRNRLLLNGFAILVFARVIPAYLA